jgi:hypothetical protein
MALVQVTVSGILKDAGGTLLTDENLIFTATDVFGDGGTTVPREPVTVTTNATTAAFSVDLYTTDGASTYVRYKVRFPNGNRKTFDLTDDDLTVDLDALINAYDGTAGASGSVALAALSGASTAGSVPFSGGQGILSEDNDAFSYDDVNHTLKLGDNDYAQGTGWQYPSYLQVANVTAYPVTSGEGFYGAKIDVNTAPSAGATQTSAIRCRVSTAASGGTPTITAVEGFANNNGSTATTSIMQGLEGIVQLPNNATTAVGGWFSVATTSGGSGTFVTNQIGVRSAVGNFNQFTVTNASAFQGVMVGNDGPVTNAYGLNLSSWNGSAIVNSYGIYMDTSIDRGTSTKYAIYSLSTSPSLLSGNLTVGGSGKFHITASQTPASATATGTVGQIAWDADYIYVCVATNTWKRTPLGSW